MTSLRLRPEIGSVIFAKTITPKQRLHRLFKNPMLCKYYNSFNIEQRALSHAH